MRRLLLTVAALTVAACGESRSPSEPSLASAAAVQPLALNRGPEQVVPGELVVSLVRGADAASVASTHGLAVGRHGYGDAFVVMRGAAGAERAMAARLARDARVAYAEPNYLRQVTTIRPEMWAFYNPGGLSIRFTRGKTRGQVVSSYFSTADADEDNVEGYAAGGAPVVLGSIDTGVDFTHPEFAPGQLIAGQDWYNNDSDPSDDEDHGTHTTGTMAGQTVGIAGVSGAGTNVRVYVQKVCGRRGCPSADIASAIRAAADYPGLVAMNLSLGGSSESNAEKSAIQYAVNTKGMLVIASAGNGGTGTVSCPACDPLAISVAASNWQDALTYYSNWGPGLDITAPGGEMYSNTSEESGIYSSVIGGYAYFQGTSMAAPQVTGTAGIVASKTGLRGSALRSRIESTTDNLGPAGYDQTFGNGRLNSYRAVTGGSLSGNN